MQLNNGWSFVHQINERWNNMVKDNTRNGEESNICNGQQEAEPIFSENESRAIVKDFIEAYISGQVEIDFPTARAVYVYDKSVGKNISIDEATKIEINIKTEFNKNVRICTGTLESTPQERRKAIDNLMSDLIFFRCSDKIKGSFTEFTFSDRIGRLEEGMDKVNNLVKEIVEWLMKDVVDD